MASETWIESHLVLLATHRADLRQSLASFEGLLTTAKAYRNAMLALATATAAFASALEECARQKGAMVANVETEEEAPGMKLMAASGLHHLMANHTQVLVGRSTSSSDDLQD